MATAFANITNKNETSVFGRNIPKQAVGKAVAVTAFSFVVLFVSCVALSAAMPTATGLDILYEAVSATATVGLTRGFTPLINLWGKWILIVTMYLGRVGPISLAIVFMVRKKSNNIIKNPTEEISIG
jgi:trk system potassium uptake protein TrkH